jgi:hypothetical protein
VALITRSSAGVRSGLLSTGFHDDQTDIPVDKPALELGACEALGFNDAPVLVGHGELKPVLSKPLRTAESTVS